MPSDARRVYYYPTAIDRIDPWREEGFPTSRGVRCGLATRVPGASTPSSQFRPRHRGIPSPVPLTTPAPLDPHNLRPPPFDAGTAGRGRRPSPSTAHGGGPATATMPGAGNTTAHDP